MGTEAFRFLTLTASAVLFLVIFLRIQKWLRT